MVVRRTSMKVTDVVIGAMRTNGNLSVTLTVALALTAMTMAGAART